MVLANIEYQGFRNLKDASVEFNHNMNLVIGANAAGKTNFLEAIFFSAFASSFRAHEDRNLIRFNDNYMRVKASTSEKTGSVFYNGDKKLTLDGLVKQRLSDYVGWLLVTILSLEDIWLVRSAPSNRRAFLDWLVAKLTPMYLHDLSEYRKILRQRNRALQMVRENGDENLLDVYDEQMVNLANKIYMERSKTMPELSATVNRVADKLGLKHLAIDYISTCPAMMLSGEALRKNRHCEILWGETTIGPHRDDIALTLNGKALKCFASEGEERLAVIALKLAEAEMLYARTHQRPVLLLDEVAAELDENKKRIFLDLVRELIQRDQGQVFYASTHIPDFLEPSHYKTINVRDGEIEVS
jgi:DNA replication and repair protein RecF